jgi:hypothetical protein
METLEPSTINTDRPFHFHLSAALACKSWAVRLANVDNTLVRRRLLAVQ